MWYSYSKIIAEKNIWKLTKEVNVKFCATSVSYVLGLGPHIVDLEVSEHLNTSCEFVNNLVYTKAEDGLSDNFNSTVVDFRDVAKAHTASLSSSRKFSNKRLLIFTGYFSKQSAVGILNTISQLKGWIC